VSRLTSWRLALRLATRDALRHRSKSVLVLVMVALPVLAVTAADVVISTSQVSGVESLDRRLGSAEAEVVVPAGGAPVIQAFDPDAASGTTADTDHEVVPTSRQVSATLGGARLLPERSGGVDFRTGHGIAFATATEVDLRDPLTRGLFTLTSGRWPAAPDEVVVNRALLDKGYAVGEPLDLVGDGAPEPVVVGVAESAESRNNPLY
jgi:putative ABC transport system permease protein